MKTLCQTPISISRNYKMGEQYNKTNYTTDAVASEKLNSYFYDTLI
jgi:hypothetical protein